MNFLRFRGSTVLADVFGAHGRAADHEEVGSGVDDGAVVLLGALRAERAGDRHSGGADLGEALLDELGLDRLRVQLLHATGGVSVVRPRISASTGSGSS